MLESEDLVHWSRQRVILCADSVDAPDTQLYDMNPISCSLRWNYWRSWRLWSPRPGSISCATTTSTRLRQ